MDTGDTKENWERFIRLQIIELTVQLQENLKTSTDDLTKYTKLVNANFH